MIVGEPVAYETPETSEKISTDTTAYSAPTYRIIHNENAGQWEARLAEPVRDPAETDDKSADEENQLGAVIAYLSYDLTDSSILFTSTVTVKRYRGFAIASELVRTALNEVRDGGRYSVIPLCSYVEHFIEKHPEYNSLLAQ